MHSTPFLDTCLLCCRIEDRNNPFRVERTYKVNWPLRRKFEVNCLLMVVILLTDIYIYFLHNTNHWETCLLMVTFSMTPLWWPLGDTLLETRYIYCFLLLIKCMWKLVINENGVYSSHPCNQCAANACIVNHSKMSPKGWFYTNVSKWLI